MIKKEKILFVYPHKSTFIQSDIDILSPYYSIKHNQYNWKNTLLTPLYLIHQFFILLINIWRIQKIVIEFGGYWSLIPSLFGKLFRIPVYIILHGTDCASIPHISYGILRKPALRFFCKQSYKLATLLLPVSASLIRTNNEYTLEETKQGVLYHFPNLKTPIEVVYNGLDVNFWKQSEKKTKEPKSFIAVFSPSQFLLKGGDLIVNLAKNHKDCTFYIAGTTKPPSITENIENLYFLGKLSREALRDYYQKSQFHFQLSIYEGFGLALCEAMLCECVPIGSSVNIIPDIIGDTGFVLNRKDQDLLLQLVEKALSLEDKKTMGVNARDRIVNHYSLDKRESELNSTLNSYQ